MEKIKNCTLLFFLIFIIGKFNAQETSFIRGGLISIKSTLCPSYQFSSKQSFFYLHTNLEGYISPKLSIVGDAYFSLGNLSNTSTFDYNHSVFFGTLWHFTKKDNDLYIGLQPGLSFTKVTPTVNTIDQTKIGINPLFSSVLGYNFYVHKFFHFFIQSRLVIGEHNYDVHKDLTELRFSAGLGFNFNTIKKKQ